MVLRDRIKLFYNLLNEEEWQECFEMIGPKLRDDIRITKEQYFDSLSSFPDAFGPLRNAIVDDLTIYSNQPNNRYDDRDFAYGDSVWTDRHNHSRKIQERWVKAADGRWYTRMAGLV